MTGKRPAPEESKDPRPPSGVQRRELQDGAYRMVFNKNTGSSYHNKTNLRDTSTEPGNLAGDRTFKRVRNPLPSDSDDDLPPDLEEVRSPNRRPAP